MSNAQVNCINSVNITILLPNRNFCYFCPLFTVLCGLISVFISLFSYCAEYGMNVFLLRASLFYLGRTTENILHLNDVPCILLGCPYNTAHHRVTAKIGKLRTMAPKVLPIKQAKRCQNLVYNTVSGNSSVFDPTTA